MSRLRVAVLGPGGVGGLLGALLSRQGQAITCLAGPATAAVIDRDGEADLLWDKLGFLAPVALLTTTLGAPLGAVREQLGPDLAAVVDEVARVARAEGAQSDAAPTPGLHPDGGRRDAVLAAGRRRRGQPHRAGGDRRDGPASSRTQRRRCAGDPPYRHRPARPLD